MSLGDNGITIYRLAPEEVEKFLSAKYGNRITAVNAGRLAKANERREKYDKTYRKTDIETA